MLEMSKQLPIVFKLPFKGNETASDYLIRLFQIHGYPWSPQHLGGMAIERRELLSVESGAHQTIATLIGCKARDVHCSTPERMSTKQVQIMGETLHRDHWITERRRWCPACWTEDLEGESLPGRPQLWNLHRRFWWSVSAVAHCPFHNCKLIDTCPYPGCDRPVFCYVGSMVQCQHGHSLLEALPTPVAPERTTPDRYILGRLGVVPAVASPLLDKGTLEEAIEIMTRLGYAAVGDPRISLMTLRSDHQAILMSEGLKVAQAWPDGFLKLLKTRPNASRGWGDDPQFGNLFRWVKAMPPKKAYNELKATMLRFIASTTAVKSAAKAKIYEGEAPTTLTRLAREVGISIAVCRKYLAALGHEPKGKGSGNTNVVGEPQRERLLELFEQCVSLRDVAEILGVTPKVVRGLVDAGILIEDPIHSKVLRGTRMFSKEQVQALLANVVDNLPIVADRDIERKGLKPLASAAQACKNLGTARAVGLILEGRLKCHGRARKALGLGGALITSRAILAAAGSCILS
jgi:DNA-binding transcriptional MerR regulator